MRKYYMNKNYNFINQILITCALAMTLIPDSAISGRMLSRSEMKSVAYREAHCAG